MKKTLPKPTLSDILAACSRDSNIPERFLRGLAKSDKMMETRDAFVWIAASYGYKYDDIGQEICRVPGSIAEMWIKAKKKHGAADFQRLLRNIRIELKMAGFKSDVPDKPNTHNPFPSYSAEENLRFHQAIKRANEFMEKFGRGREPYDATAHWFGERKYLD